MIPDEQMWHAFSPFFNPTQVRILVALRTMGPSRRRDLAARLGHSQGRLAPHLTKLNRWGIVNYDFKAHRWFIHDWDASLDAMKKAVESHLRGTLHAIEDFRNAELWPELEKRPAYDHAAYLLEVRPHGP